ncbi:TPA: gamma-glutamylcyclotransferase [Candidatus Woesearchaeota archaeon]|nr:gamma-glutamylcyclotransferase [Candidatus Woesearchaeota archaeon]
MTKNRLGLELVFVYDMLKDPEVQMREIGRVCTSTPDRIDGMYLDEVLIDEERHLIAKDDPKYLPIGALIFLQRVMRLAVPAGINSISTDTHINGVVLELTQPELEKLDEYETAAYDRRQAVLASGRHAWVYMEPCRHPDYTKPLPDLKKTN